MTQPLVSCHTPPRASQYVAPASRPDHTLERRDATRRAAVMLLWIRLRATRAAQSPTQYGPTGPRRRDCPASTGSTRTTWVARAREPTRSRDVVLLLSCEGRMV